jgi:CubicO group peptidase (beta-lactamase class C family)
MSRRHFASVPLLLGLLLLCLPAPPAGADDAPEAPRRLADDVRVADAVRAWHEWVEYQAAIDGIPGISLGVVHDQELIAANAFGLADPEAGIPATPKTLYSICSISKLFTSVAVMQQRDAGKLRLDDPVAVHLDWFDLQDRHPDDEAITVRRLLTHSAGLPRESDYPYWTAAEYPFPTSEQIRRRLGEQQTLYPASRYFQYSNLGLALAGELVAATSGRSYGEYIRQEILDPLGMESTYTDVPSELRGDRLAVGYSARGRDGKRRVVAPFRTRGIAPAAGFASNVGDLARFARWQFRLLGEGGEELLRASTLREMQRVQWVDPDWETTWGLGFSVTRVGERTFARHGGGCPGYYTEFRLEPKTRIGVIVLTNSIGSEVGLYANEAFDIIAPAIAEALERPKELPKRDPALDRYTGVYDSIWGQYAIVRWGDGLAALWLKNRDIKDAFVRLKPSGEQTFRIVRKDDESAGDAIVFELDEAGQVLRFKRHSNIYVKVR